MRPLQPLGLAFLEIAFPEPREEHQLPLWLTPGPLGLEGTILKGGFHQRVPRDLPASRLALLRLTQFPCPPRAGGVGGTFQDPLVLAASPAVTLPFAAHGLSTAPSCPPLAIAQHELNQSSLQTQN